MTALQQQLVIGVLFLLLDWLVSKVGIRDIGRVLRFRPAKWRRFRVARLEEQLKWDKRVHGSAYELCLYMFYELLLLAIFSGVTFEYIFINSYSSSKPFALVLGSFIFLVLSRLFRLFSMMHRLTNYDREIPKIEAKLECLIKQQKTSIRASSVSSTPKPPDSKTGAAEM